MVLTFAYAATLTPGHRPQAVHMMDNTLHIFYLTDSGEVHGLKAAPPLGNFDNLAFSEAGRVATDKNVSAPSLKKIAHFGACGFWSAAPQEHRFVNYALPFDLSDVHIDGNIQASNDSSVSQVSFSALNINNSLMGKYKSSVTPGAKIELTFSMGRSIPFKLGTFYADRVSGRREDAKISVSGRNNIGKLLKEQTFDEQTVFASGNLRDNFIAILELAGVENYFVADTTLNWTLTFEPNTAILDGLQAVVQLIAGWKLSENADGTIGIGPASDARFDQPSTFTFYRDKTCWSCEATQDDESSYSRVCIRCKNPAATVFRDLPPCQYWPIAEHKTLYVDVPDGTTADQINAYAETLTDTIPVSGRTETFAGIFTPHLMIGDNAEVVENDGRSSVAGIVTSVTHSFGRGGFYTQFTVDSGGRIGRPLLKDLISQISGNQKTSSVVIS